MEDHQRSKNEESEKRMHFMFSAPEISFRFYEYKTQDKIEMKFQIPNHLPSKKQINMIIEWCKSIAEASDNEIKIMNNHILELDMKSMAQHPSTPKEKPKISGHVYFVIESSGKTKIGKSQQLKNRLKCIGHSLPINPILHHAIKTNDIDNLEILFHQKYHQCRMNGEWFDLSPSELDEIKKIEEMEI